MPFAVYPGLPTILFSRLWSRYLLRKVARIDEELLRQKEKNKKSNDSVKYLSLCFKKAFAVTQVTYKLLIL